MTKTTYIFYYGEGLRILNSPYTRYFEPLGVTEDRKYMYLISSLPMREAEKIMAITLSNVKNLTQQTKKTV